jgi:hypothetical protein
LNPCGISDCLCAAAAAGGADGAMTCVQISVWVLLMWDMRGTHRMTLVLDLSWSRRHLRRMTCYEVVQVAFVVDIQDSLAQTARCFPGLACLVFQGANTHSVVEE